MTIDETNNDLDNLAQRVSACEDLYDRLAARVGAIEDTLRGIGDVLPRGDVR